tara:strand:- start:276 stop:1061 length:786 start_codon:yes stop_codon:yes gene_type:complete
MASKKFSPCIDQKISSLKQRFFEESQTVPTREEFIEQATEWFLSTRLNKLTGLESFAHKDIIIGCTQFIENICLKQKWNIQILPEEYAYYTVMGKQPTKAGELQENVPLLISAPNWKHGQRSNWQDILEECVQKNIDVHVDCAWLTVAKDIEINFDHPCIKSIGMSISKYIGSWNRIGIRWSKQKTLDSVTMFNTQMKYNDALVSCGSFIMKNLDRDYGWNTYGKKYEQICTQHNYQSTNYFYLAKKDNEIVGMTDQLLSK